ncbi:squalene/phytoene synthase family protein [Roseomonas sp. BN140053]|uniref:squalene/phytoene synthase family protein n=1 Tax=Roseomonas sp. BN140053 TaxID=3391898 RepID=UPI0039ED55B2
MPAIGALARDADPDRFLCALFAPPGKREAIFALIAFDRELARAGEVTSQPTLALIRLQWWREVVEAAAEGKPPRRHEVAEPLHRAIAAGELDATELAALIDAREAETELPFPARGAFEAYLSGTGGGFLVTMGRCLGAPSGLLPSLLLAGELFALARVLRHLPAWAVAGRCPLPEDLLAVAGASADAFDPNGAAVQALSAQLAAAALPQLAQCRATLANLPRAAVSAALPAVLARRDLRRLAAGRGTVAPGTGRGLGDRLAVTLAGLRGRV